MKDETINEPNPWKGKIGRDSHYGCLVRLVLVISSIDNLGLHTCDQLVTHWM